MSREICIVQDFLEESQKEQIRSTAEKVGFVTHFFGNAQAEEAIAVLPACEILFTQHPAVTAANGENLKWLCVSSAGVDVYCKPGFFRNPDCMLTNSNVYGVTISEYTVMTLLMMLRRMPEYEEIVRRHEWGAQLPIHSIYGSTIHILGAGQIGTTIAHRLKAMGAAKIIGISRSGKARDAVYDEMRTIDQLDSILPDAHILIMALPGTGDTDRLMNGARIALLPKDALVMNVGRGTALEQQALVEALNEGRIAGAALDVTTPEPLPADDPLWEAKNLILTPHVSGNTTLAYTRQAIVDQFCEDIENYAAGRPLRYLVDRKRGY